ncbi:hypothetical protein SeMB42_g00531 [Synchytrium endobioticum]|uniref:Uncharacterized protein n=1 Tax=Synchytrium endobioticum TaxID=286115 RepID=A0A507DSQ4_9FUNG|nr:hypothetical protein SeMB42_g00531 [Synchytrium endobioticum]
MDVRSNLNKIIVALGDLYLGLQKFDFYNDSMVVWLCCWLIRPRLPLDCLRSSMSCTPLYTLLSMPSLTAMSQTARLTGI